MIYNGKHAAVDHGPIVQFEAGLEKWLACQRVYDAQRQQNRARAFVRKPNQGELDVNINETLRA